MPRITSSDYDGNSYFRVLGHRPGVASRWSELDEELRFNGTLDPELKEQVRRAMAPAVGCTFCHTLGGDRRPEVDARTSLASAYALQVVAHHDELDDSLFTTLREEFDEGEIVELTMWICFITAGQMFGAILDIGPATPADREAFQLGLSAAARRPPAAVR